MGFPSKKNSLAVQRASPGKKILVTYWMLNNIKMRPRNISSHTVRLIQKNSLVVEKARSKMCKLLNDTKVWYQNKANEEIWLLRSHSISAVCMNIAIISEGTLRNSEKILSSYSACLLPEVKNYWYGIGNQIIIQLLTEKLIDYPKLHYSYWTRKYGGFCQTFWIWNVLSIGDI